MSHRLASVIVAILTSLGLLTLNGCASVRNLKITEVSLDAVELYLDEQRDNSLDLASQKLKYVNSNGDQSELDLFGTIRGSGFLIVWEASSYTGPPVAQDYVDFQGNNVPGIVVQQGFFANPQAETFAYRVYGRGTRYIFPFFIFYDDVDDVVKFGGGPMGLPRPNIGGAFHETQQLGATEVRVPGQGLTPASTISRLWNAATGKPLDTDDESDWEKASDNLGSPTP
jgi:hypothetical protein